MIKDNTDPKRLPRALLWSVLFFLCINSQSSANEADKLNQQINHNSARLDKAEAELKKFDKAISETQLKIESLRERVRVNREELASIDEEIRQAQKRSGQHEQNISNYVRASFMMGREAPVKLLLSQDDPAQAGRVMSYYRYFFNAHKEEVEQIRNQIKQSEILKEKKQSQSQRLEKLLTRLEQDLAFLETKRGNRKTFIASLESKQKAAWRSMQRLKEDGKRLGSLSKGISRMQKNDSRTKSVGTAFAKRKGRLEWPANGRILARFGNTRKGSSQLRWQGLLISTNFGDKVSAVSGGKVVFADWMRGYGYLIIVDHGGGYMTLYGHNEALLKSVGESVEPGDALALSGNSGRTGDPALYFEIRFKGEPVNPRRWMVASK